MKRGFGELELTILKILSSGDRKTVKDVHHLIGEPSKYTTIMTVMNRLVDKKKLAREKMGLQYEYWAIHEAEVPSFLDKFREKIFGVNPAKLVSCLFDSPESITDEELLEIEKLVQAAKEKRKKHV